MNNKVLQGTVSKMSMGVSCRFLCAENEFDLENSPACQDFWQF